MLFSSITFLYFFLPFTIFAYYFVPDKCRNFVLFIMSVLFYAWGEPVYVFLMLAQIIISFVLTWLADMFENTYHNKITAGIFYALAVILAFGALLFYKFSSVLPIGISFYTFQITSYCIDVYHGRVKRQKSFIDYATYVTMFPQLVAGPIVRYSNIEETLTHGIDKTKIPEKFEKGITRFAIGLGKKVLVANVIGEFVAEVAGMDTRTILLSWAYAVSVSLQIYFDFSGYSDMAIGLGAMLGFDFPENFDYPFTAKSVREFWRRWHITLGSWFRDYVYIPLGGNRVGFIRWIFNILVVWSLTGLWHGAGWNFILWGLYFAVFLVIEKLIKKIFPKVRAKILGHVYLVLIVMISFLIFNADSLQQAWSDIGGLWSVREALDPDSLVECAFILKNRIGILIIGIVGATPIPKMAWERVSMKFKSGNLKLLTAVFAIALIVLSTAYIIDGSFNPFLYFRF